MAVGKKYFNSETLMQLAVFLSMTRPDLQQYLQNSTETLREIPGGYNWTGPYISHYGTATAIHDYLNTNPKDNAAAFDQSADPLADLLSWHDYGRRNEEFINMQGGVILENEAHVDTESGYSSDHNSLSPTPSSTASASPTHDGFSQSIHGSQTDLSHFGASGFTPATQDPELYKLLQDSFEEDFDFGNLSPNDQFSPSPLVKSEPLSPPPFPGYGFSCPLTKGADQPNNKAGSLEDSSFYYHQNHKSTLEQIGLQNNFHEDVFDPYSIDWSSPSPNTNETVAQPELSFNSFDLDPLASSWADDFNLPLDILNPPTTEQPQIEENKATPQNDSGIPISGSGVLETFDSSISRDLVPPTSVAVKSEDFSNPRAVLVARKASSSTEATPAAKKVNNAGKRKSTQERITKLQYSDSRIIDMPVEEFNVLMEEMTEAQAKYARDLRRRGKNKEAARVCRKRKLEVIGGLEEEILEMKAQKQKILDEREKLKAETVSLKSKVSELQTYVLKSLRDDQGLPLSPKEYSLFQGEDGKIFVAKNLGS